MDDAELLMRIRVVVGSTRAAAHSVGGDAAQLEAVLDRGRWLLDAMAPDIERSGSGAVRERFAEAWEELAAMSPDRESEAEQA
jgi:hypothetical protein